MIGGQRAPPCQHSHPHARTLTHARAHTRRDHALASHRPSKPPSTLDGKGPFLPTRCPPPSVRRPVTGAPLSPSVRRPVTGAPLSPSVLRSVTGAPLSPSVRRSVTGAPLSPSVRRSVTGAPPSPSVRRSVTGAPLSPQAPTHESKLPGHGVAGHAFLDYLRLCHDLEPRDVFARRDADDREVRSGSGSGSSGKSHAWPPDDPRRHDP